MQELASLRFVIIYSGPYFVRSFRGRIEGIVLGVNVTGKAGVGERCAVRVILIETVAHSVNVNAGITVWVVSDVAIHIARTLPPDRSYAPSWQI